MYVASLILSLLSLILSWVPILNILLAIAALIVSIVAISRKSEKNDDRAMAIAGIVISIISTLISIIICVAIGFFVVNIPSLLKTVTTEIKEEIDINEISGYVEAETMLSTKYVQVIIKNKNNEYTGYINSSTEEYTDILNGIEVNDYYENYLKENGYDYDVHINNLGEPSIEKD